MYEIVKNGNRMGIKFESEEKALAYIGKIDPALVGMAAVFEVLETE